MMYCKPVICIETGKEYPSTKQAGKEMFISQSAISNAANGKRKTAAGYHWKFRDEKSREQE